MSRFHKTERNTYQKYITWNNKSYHIVIPNEIWNTTHHRCINDHIHYWKRHQDTSFKYGTVTEVDSPHTQVSNTCSICNKTYKSRTGLLRHIKIKHPPEETKEDTPAPSVATSTAITTQNITNNNITNNIQQNIVIRPFGKENPKWITESVIVNALKNIPGAIINLVREKHFNDAFPENRNVEMCNEFKNRYLQVHEESRVRICGRKQMLERMCHNACDAVTTTLESYSDPPDSDESEDEDETPEDRRCRLVANRIRRDRRLSSMVDEYIHKWEEYVSSVVLDDVLKDADHYITMLLLDLKYAIKQQEDTGNIRTVMRSD
jgi:hypothetical protein